MKYKKGDEGELVGEFWPDEYPLVFKNLKKAKDEIKKGVKCNFIRSWTTVGRTIKSVLRHIK